MSEQRDIIDRLIKGIVEDDKPAIAAIIAMIQKINERLDKLEQRQNLGSIAGVPVARIVEQVIGQFNQAGSTSPQPADQRPVE